MNANLLNAVRSLTASQGAVVLLDPGKVDGSLPVFAGKEPAGERKALIQCLALGLPGELQNCPDRQERLNCKNRAAGKLASQEFSAPLVREIVDLIDALVPAGARAPAPQRPAPQNYRPPARQVNSPPPRQPDRRQPAPPRPGPPPSAPASWQPGPAAPQSGAVPRRGPKLYWVFVVLLALFIVTAGYNVAAVSGNLNEDFLNENGLMILLETASRLGLVQTIGIIGTADDPSSVFQDPRVLREFNNVLYDWYAPVKWPPVLSISKEAGLVLLKARINGGAGGN